MEYEIRVETNERVIFNQLEKKLQSYRNERRGPTMLVIQSILGKRLYKFIHRYFIESGILISEFTSSSIEFMFCYLKFFIFEWCGFIISLLNLLIVI